MTSLETWEFLSYVVTVIGLPFAIVVFWVEQRKEREAEDEELQARLNQAYTDFLKLVLDNADLQMLRRGPMTTQLSPEQEERRYALFGILIALFEQAYLMVYEEDMPRQRQRMWQVWADYMEEWCRREDFRALLPELLRGEDPEFAAYLRRLAAEVEQGQRMAT
ncbi:MAG: hypothetical protein NZ524_10650 [Thiobacillaceae bacterium]|nr:hypothetical protein [Thiobacillaceae bacterium]MCX7673235.1 hypothetical protein [Thiobacillaceae bacterium]MDW8324433.1 hypothetical protein [Burkholderiales bacterium]